MFWAVVLVGLGAIAGGYWLVRHLVELSTGAVTPAQRFTAAFAVATAMGAFFPVVVNVRT